MMRFLRYALATFCFAASIGCLLLWFLGVISQIGYYSTTWNVTLDTDGDYAWLDFGRLPPFPRDKWIIHTDLSEPSIDADWRDGEVIGQDDFGAIFFPLWYPALIFTFTGVGVLRIRRKCSIRSAMIATTVVAALVGIAVVF